MYKSFKRNKEGLPAHEAKQFAWKRESGTMEIYQHMDGQDGQFHDRNREPISPKQGLDYAMPEGQAHSHF